MRAAMRLGERVLWNEAFGERVEFRRTGAETGGALIECELVLSKAGAGPGPHVHPQQEERFRVLSGSLAVQIGDVERVLVPGDEAAVPPGTLHAWRKLGAGETVVWLQLEPALRFEEILEEIFRMEDEGLWADPAAVAFFIERYADEFQII
jgi:quercetin dioxygenase-like cupin family protein